MKCIHTQFGYRQKGKVIEISLTHSTDVRLMVSASLSRYRAGRNCRYDGAIAKRSPTKLAIPNAGSWYVAVDAQDLRNMTRASALILRCTMPALEETLLSAVCNTGSEAGK